MNNNQHNTINLLRALSGQDNIFTIPKLYVRLTKCHTRGLILNQIVFYSDKSTRHSDDWFDKTYEEWEEQTYVKERTLRNIFNEFEKKKWCETKTCKVNGKRSLMCRPFIENILKDLQEMLESEDETGKICRIANRKNLPDSQPEKFAVSIYTDKTTDKTTDNNMSSNKDKKTKFKASEYQKDERFMRFYNAYPRKQKGSQAYKMWLKLNPDDLMIEEILNDITNRLTHDSGWMNGCIHLPATYLNPNEPVFKQEIFNADKVKQESKKAQFEVRQKKEKERLEKQEQASKLRAENERKNNELKQSDAVAYRNTIKQAPSKATQNALKGLMSHLRG